MGELGPKIVRTERDILKRGERVPNGARSIQHVKDLTQVKPKDVNEVWK